MNSPDAPPSSLEPTLQEATITHVRASISRGLQKRAMAAGPELWNAVMASVSPECRAVFSQPLGPFQWVAVPHVNEVGLAYNRIAGGDDLDLRAAMTAEEHLTVSHPWLLKLLSADTLVRQGPTIFHFYHRGGVVRSESLAPGRCVFSIWAVGLYDGWATTALPAWLRRALELTGAVRPRVEYLPPPLGSFRHRYVLHWEAGSADDRVSDGGP